MKKNPKPLIFRIHPDLMGTDEVGELIRKGHSVIELEDLKASDLVIGPNCYRISEETISLMELAVKSTRAAKYPTKRKGDDVETA